MIGSVRVMHERPHILLVISENDTSELELLVYFLRGAGFRVTCTHDVASSQRVLLTKAIDIAVVDAVLADRPSTSIAAFAAGRGIPAVTMTRSLPLHDSRRRDAYMRRPVSFPALRDAIDGALRRRDEVIAACRQVRRLSPDTGT